MRKALAQRMKQDLVLSQADQVAKAQALQYDELDHQLRVVEAKRKENRKKEAEMFDQISETQEQRMFKKKELVSDLQ